MSGYPTPSEEHSLTCGCEDLSVKWPPLRDSEDQIFYDPSAEKGTDFVCQQSIDTASGEFIIETDNSCILFCDSYLVADVRCLNGEWTGQPELGFWCYQEPIKEDNALTPADTEEPAETTLAAED